MVLESKLNAFLTKQIPKVFLHLFLELRSTFNAVIASTVNWIVVHSNAHFPVAVLFERLSHPLKLVLALIPRVVACI